MNKSNQKNISQEIHKISILKDIDDQYTRRIIFSNNVNLIYKKKSIVNNFIISIPGTPTKHFIINDSGVHLTSIDKKYFDLPNEIKNIRNTYRQYTTTPASIKIKKNIKNAIDEQKQLTKTESSSKLVNYDIYKINPKKTLPEILIKLLYDISEGNKFEYTQLRNNQICLIVDGDGSIEMIKYKKKKTVFLDMATNINLMNKCAGMDLNHKLYKSTFPKNKTDDLKPMLELIQDFIFSIKP